MEKKKNIPLWHLRVAAARSSFYFNQIFLPIFPYDHTFLTVAYKTMIYNEFHRPTTGFSWSSEISSQEKMGGKMSKNPKYRTLQAVKLGLLQSCYCSNQRRSYFCYWSSIVAHQQAMMMWEQQQKQTIVCSPRTQAYKMDTFQRSLHLKDPRLQDNKALHL